MALTDESNMVMPIAPMNGGFGNGLDGNGWWILLLFVLLGGWGNGFGGYGNGGAGFVDTTVQRGFDQSAIMGGLTGLQGAVTSGFGDVQTALCGGFAGVNAGIANGFAQAEIAANARAMTDMQTMFGIQSSLQNCCCENRAGLADLKYTVATENCADRQVISDGIRDLVMAQNAGTQRILDQLCQDKIDAKNDTIAQLRSELMYARGQASQDVQTAQIIANNEAQTGILERYLAPTPIPAYVVANPNGCGCSACGA